MTTLIERQREVESLERETYAGTRIIEEAEELLSKRRSRVGYVWAPYVWLWVGPSSGGSWTRSSALATRPPPKTPG